MERTYKHASISSVLAGKAQVSELFQNQLNNFVIPMSESKIEGLWECWLFDLLKVQSASFINRLYPKKISLRMMVKYTQYHYLPYIFTLTNVHVYTHVHTQE